MLGILITLAISCLLLKFLENRNFSVLGLFPTKRRLQLFLIEGISFITLIALLIYLDSKITDGKWNTNTSIDYLLLINSGWYYFKSALFEDFMFRGAILFILVFIKLKKLYSTYGIEANVIQYSKN